MGSTGKTEDRKQSKKEVISKILSFSYKELSDWIHSRLHGDDKYFSIYEGHEINLSDFLGDAFHQIKDEKFRNNFLEILNDLVNELKRYPAKEIEDNKEYIYELFTLCSAIKRFEDKVTLIELAESGKFKGIRIYDTDLHLVLLTALSSYRVGGNHRFWVKQMQDDSNKYYTNAAFYAFLNNGYSLDILFKNIGLLVHRFKGQFELVLAIESLFDEYKPQKIYRKFKEFGAQFSFEQKEAINHAFKEAGYEVPYKLGKIADKDKADEKSIYKIPVPKPQYVGVPTVEYGTGTDVDLSLKEKTAEIFKLMGFDVELNRRIAGCVIDIFLKKKNSMGNRYECWICLCDSGGDKDKKRVGKAAVDRLYSLRKSVKEELEKQPGICCDDCQVVIVSEIGFTRGAIETAGALGIELRTLEQLFSGLAEFHSSQKQLTQSFETCLSQRSKL